MKPMDGRVGLFFVVEGRIILYDCPLDHATRYGDFLNYPFSHDAVWRRLQHARYGVDFDYYPRGRIVYSVPDERYTVYYDRCCQLAARMIVRSFPAGSADSAPDEHYQCHGCNPQYCK